MSEDQRMTATEVRRRIREAGDRHGPVLMTRVVNAMLGHPGERYPDEHGLKVWGWVAFGALWVVAGLVLGWFFHWIGMPAQPGGLGM